MANIIRCKLPDGVHRFKPFTVEDYRDFLLVRNDIEHRSPQEQKEIIADLIADYFGDYPKTWQPFIFLQVFVGSIGKTKVPVTFACPKCKKEKTVPFEIYQKELKEPIFDVANVRIKLNFPSEFYENKAKMITENIHSVQVDEIWYDWKEISESSQIELVDAIEIETLEKILDAMNPINLTLHMSCCNKYVKKYTDIVDVFKLLVNPDEIFTFYQINHTLVKSNYSLNSIMKMIPAERGFVLKLIEKDKQQ